MKTTIKKLPKSKIEILFEIPPEELEKFRQKAIFRLGEELEIEGFRKGQAPKEIIEEKIGQEKILGETVQETVRESYREVILEEGIEPLGEPETEIQKIPTPGSQLEFKITLSVFPEIDLPDYKKIASQVKKNKVLVEEEEVKEALFWLQKSRAKLTLKNQPAQKGDFVEINFQSPQIEAGMEKKDGFILGEGHLVPGFEENLVGMVNGQEKNFSLKFSENHFQKDLAGKNLDFKVKMNSVQKVELPEINDQWAKSFGRFENLISLENNIREGINLEKEMTETQRVRQEILEKVSQDSKLEIPEIMIEEEQKKVLEEIKEKVFQTLKGPFKDYLAKIRKTEEELKNSFLEETKKRIKNSLVLRKIAQKEKIEVLEEEVKEEMDQFLKNYPIEKTKKLDLERLKLYIEGVIRDEKTFQLLETEQRRYQRGET